MTAEQQALLERSREAIRLSVSLVPETCAVQARAVALRREIARDRPRQFPTMIHGPSIHEMDTRAIRGRVVAAILPHAAPAKAVYGPGDGKVCCCGCDRVVNQKQIQVEAVFGDEPTLCFHWRCFKAWQKARQALEGDILPPDSVEQFPRWSTVRPNVHGG